VAVVLNSGDLAVVTVTFSPGEHLAVFLDSLDAATTLNPQVVLADNGSTDGAPQHAAATRDRVALLATGANIGYGAAVNRAVAGLPEQVQWVLVANPDIRFHQGSLDMLLGAAEQWPRAAALGPLVREPDGRVYPSARAVPDLVSGTGHALLSRVWPANPFSAAYRRTGEVPRQRTAGWLSGSCILLRRSAFCSIGGFDSRYFMYFEDVDLGDRLTRAGWHNAYVPDAEVVHEQGHAANRAPAQMLAAHHASAYRFQADRHPGMAGAPVRWVLRAGLAARHWAAIRSA